MLPRIEIKPVWANMSDDDLKKQIAESRKRRETNPGLEFAYTSDEPAQALVQRYLEKSTVSRFVLGAAEKDEIKKICDNVLEYRKDDNYFNFALAVLVDDSESQKTYLQRAAISTKPFGTELSGQAAFELTKLFYAEDKNFSGKPFIETEAWFVRAVMLGYKEASEHFCKYGKYHDNMSSFSVLATSNSHELITSFLTIILSGYQIKDFLISNLLNNKLESPRTIQFSPFRNAHALKNPANALSQQDSSVKTIADMVVSNQCEAYLYDFFHYCYDMNIVSKAVYEGVLQYLSTCDLRVKPDVLEQVQSEIIRLQQVGDLLVLGSAQASVSSNLSRSDSLKQQSIFSGTPKPVPDLLNPGSEAQAKQQQNSTPQITSLL